MQIKESHVVETQELTLCAMNYDYSFMNDIGIQIPPSVWEDDWARTLAMWVSDYAKAYNTVPKDALFDFVKGRCRTMQDEETGAAIRRFAKHLQEYHEEHSALFVNEKYLRDTILSWVKERSLAVLSQQIQQAIDEGNLARAEEAVHRYSEVKQVECNATDLMHDAAEIQGAYEEDAEELLTLPGALGELIGPMSRGDLLLALGESGTGKSWLCLKIAKEAVKLGLSVLYFNLENSHKKMLKRIYASFTGKPKKDMVVEIPYFKASSSDVDDDGNEEEGAKYQILYAKKELTAPDTSLTEITKFLSRMRTRSNGGRFLMKSYAPLTFSMRDLNKELDDLRDYKNFVPDIVIIDYIDLMRPDNPREDKRIKVDGLYLGARSVALDRNVLLVSPSQSNRAGYNKNLSKVNMAENIGNVAHATMIVGIQHTKEEKEKGITRMSMLKCRDNVESAGQVICLGSMAIGEPFLKSKWLKDVEYSADDDSDYLED